MQPPGKLYNFNRREIAAALTALLGAHNVAVDRPAVDAGLATLAAGGAFADGVIAHQGHWLGGDTFVSFDRKAVTLLKNKGMPRFCLPRRSREAARKRATL